MQKIKQKLSILKNSRLATRVLLALFASLVICVVFVGLDNATGIVLGWLATTSLIMAMAHTWRKIWYFIVLLFASFLGAIFLAFLYMEVALPLAGWVGDIDVTQSTAWRIFHLLVSNIILLVTPMGIIIGIVGSLWLGILRLVALRYRSHTGGT